MAGGPFTSEEEWLGEVMEEAVLGRSENEVHREYDDSSQVVPEAVPLWMEDLQSTRNGADRRRE